LGGRGWLLDRCRRGRWLFECLWWSCSTDWACNWGSWRWGRWLFPQFCRRKSATPESKLCARPEGPRCTASADLFQNGSHSPVPKWTNKSCQINRRFSTRRFLFNCKKNHFYSLSIPRHLVSSLQFEHYPHFSVLKIHRFKTLYQHLLFQTWKNFCYLICLKLWFVFKLYTPCPLTLFVTD
jgi:hypothetical protein